MKAVIVLCLALCAVGTLASRDDHHDSYVSNYIMFKFNVMHRAQDRVLV